MNDMISVKAGEKAEFPFELDGESKVTIEHIEKTVRSETFINPPGTTLTICVLTLQNGFTVTGESACVSPENFDEQVGREIARANAIDKVWMLEGYLLKEKIERAKRQHTLCGLAETVVKGGHKYVMLVDLGGKGRFRLDNLNDDDGMNAFISSFFDGSSDE